MTNCPICKRGKLKRITKKQIHTYKEQSIEIMQPGDWCDSCGEGVLSSDDIRETDKEIRDFHAQVNGLLTSYEVREIRKKLNLTQRDAARICGGGPNAFSRYERGEATPIRATSNLLRLLVKYPDELHRLLSAKQE